MKNKVSLSLAVISMALLGITVKTCSDKNNQKQEFNHIQEALNDSLKVYRDLNGNSVSKIQALSLDNTKQLLQLKGLQGDNLRLQQEVQKHRNAQMVAVSKTKVETRVVEKEVRITDTVKINNQTYPIYESNFDKEGWITGSVRMSPDSLEINPIQVNIDQTYVLKSERKWFLAPEKTYLEVHNKNPYAQTESLKIVIKKPKNPNRWIPFVGGLILGGTGVYLMTK